jgi:hypothetical protein
MSMGILVTGILTITAAVTGWMLNEVSFWIRLRREDKAPVGVLLVALAEIRHRITTTNRYFQRLRETVPIPPEAMPFLRRMMDEILPNFDSLNHQYDSAIHQLSGRNPGLAFRLHSKNHIPSVLSKLRQHPLSVPLPAEEYEPFEQYLMGKIFPALDKAILELAKAHSCRTRRQYERQVRDWNDKTAMSKDMDDMIAELRQIGQPERDSKII